MAIAAACMIFLPSFLDYVLIGRFKFSVSTLAVPSLAIFLVGIFLMIRLLRE
jgi:hypothetical protein